MAIHLKVSQMVASKVNREEKASQTDPPAKKTLLVSTPKRKREEEGALPSPKKQVRQNTSEKWKLVGPKKKRLPKDQKAEKSAKSATPRKEKPKPPRPLAILIAATGEKSYADIFRVMKTQPELREAVASVIKIRKTAKGELFLQLKTKSSEGEKKEAMENVLEKTATVRTLCQRKTVECRDLDEITTIEDIISSIKEHLPAVETLRKHYIKLFKRKDGTQTAKITLPAADGNKMIEAGHLRVGWVRCRLRENLVPLRCFKCLKRAKNQG